jgi:hypothetical protein
MLERFEFGSGFFLSFSTKLGCSAAWTHPHDLASQWTQIP